MKVDSLDELAAAFNRWRKKKQHVQERVPDELWERALRATRVHGLRSVVRATKIKRTRLVARRKRTKTRPGSTPTFSRVEIAAPSAAPQPIAEVETAAGLKLRVFVQTRETVGLLSSLCGIGGAR
jgi:hypothetical protein